MYILVIVIWIFLSFLLICFYLFHALKDSSPQASVDYETDDLERLTATAVLTARAGCVYFLPRFLDPPRAAPDLRAGGISKAPQMPYGTPLTVWTARTPLKAII